MRQCRAKSWLSIASTVRIDLTSSACRRKLQTIVASAFRRKLRTGQKRSQIMKLFVCLAAALSIAALTARAQSPPADAPAFDVVSVKRNTSGGPMLQRNTPGNIAMFNVPVRQIVRLAYQLQDFQIVGAPDWANTDRFDIEGRFEPPPPGPPPQTPRMLLMLRTLLRDRFGMAAQMETREMPILALRLVRADGG